MLWLETWKRYLPEGTKDIIFNDCKGKKDVINIFSEIYTSRGFKEIISPTLEFYDVFSGENKSIEQEKMYKLFDNTGRILALRPDMTTPIARIAATKLKNVEGPIRIFYNGNIFRVNEIWDGKNSEITQSGIEILGAENSKADLTAIITAIEALLAVGIESFQIELGQAEFYRGLMEDIHIDKDELNKMKTFIENKNYTSLKEFIDNRQEFISKESAEALKSLPELFGNIEVLDRARKLTKNPRALRALDNISEICEKLGSIGLGSYITIDLGMIQHIHYYTGIIFRGYSTEACGNILSGGRYDNLIGQFGKDMPAVGFAIDVDSVLQSLKLQNDNNRSNKKKIFIQYKEEYLDAAYRAANELINKGVIVEMSLFDDIKEAVLYCNANNIKRIINFTEAETVSVVGLENSQDVNMRITDFITSLGV